MKRGPSQGENKAEKKLKLADNSKSQNDSKKTANNKNYPIDPAQFKAESLVKDFAEGKVSKRLCSLDESKLDIYHGCVLSGVKKTTPLNLLQIASINGHLNILNFLSVHDVDLKVRESCGMNLLHDASEYGRDSIVQYLIKNGFNVNKTDNMEYTPLVYAAKSGYTETVQVLLDNGANVDGYIETPIQFAAMNGHKETVRVLLKNGADVDKLGHLWNGLHFAAMNGHTEIVQVLLDSGANIDQEDKLNGNSAL